ncbi:MAG: xanthine dehydrogenase family protein subunit M [Thermoleophilia bacterium]|nr:xanthine dehydrogenase family protein subunit M [Thermoleophilia bacterium]
MSLIYQRVTERAQALEVLEDRGAAAVPLAGGTDVMPGIRAGRYPEGVIVDITRVDELREMSLSGGSAVIGSLVTAAELARSPQVDEALPSLAAAARSLGSPQVRARATVGGNVANASPAADLLVALTALEAGVSLASHRGERTLPIDTFMLAPGLTRRAPDELILGFRIPLRDGARTAFTKVGLRRALACALVNLAMTVMPSPDGRSCTEASIALGAVAPTCLRARRAERLLVGREVDAELVSAVARAAAEETAPLSDIRGSAAYRRHLVSVHVERALLELFPSHGSASTNGRGEV